MTAFACLLIALGAWMAYRQKSREHRRLNQLGAEVFPTYAAKLLAKTAGTARWLMVATLVTTGVVLLAVQYESTWGWVVLLPLYAWLLFLMLGT
jgi:hypothetical protein